MTTGDGQVLTVAADGKPLGHGDIDRRVLHVLPKLFVPASAVPHLDKEEIGFNVKSTLGVDIAPPGGVTIRQPYPNTRYFVGGSGAMRNGWVVALPEGVNEFDIEFQWELYGPKLWNWLRADEWECRHLIHVQLQPGKGRMYSMDASCWPRIEGGKVGQSAVTLVGHREDDDLSMKDRSIVRVASLIVPDDPHDPVGHYLEEELAIPPIAYEQAWSLNAFQEEQIHEVRHETNFTEFVDLHRQNASVEMPAALFIEAIKLARSVPYAEDSAFARSVAGQAGGLESHPAMKLLCGWWEQNRKDGQKIKVGCAMPWIRVRNDADYWCGNPEEPTAEIGDFAKYSTAGASLGDLALVLFLASHEHFTFDDNGTDIYLADGQPYSSIGISKEEVQGGEYDEAYYSLKALAWFPSRFPAAYEALLKAAKK